MRKAEARASMRATAGTTGMRQARAARGTTKSFGSHSGLDYGCTHTDGSLVLVGEAN